MRLHWSNCSSLKPYWLEVDLFCLIFEAYLVKDYSNCQCQSEIVASFVYYVSWHEQWVPAFSQSSRFSLM